MPTVRKIARRMSRTRQDAEDATQVALIEILRCASAFRGDGPLRGWAAKIAMRSVARTGANAAAQAKRDVDTDSPVGFEELSTAVVDALPRPLRSYLEDLSEEQATALVLRHSLGCTIPEVAAITDSPIPTVKSRLSTALARIRQSIRRDIRFGAAKVGA